MGSGGVHALTHMSPMTDGGSRGSDAPSPAPSRGSFSGRPGSRGRPVIERNDDAMDGSTQAQQVQQVQAQQAAAIAQVQAQQQVQQQAQAAAHAAQAQANAHAQAAAQAQAQVNAQVQAQAQAAQAHAQAQADSQVQTGLQNGQMAGAIPMNGDQTLYNGEPMGMTPVFAETPAWLTENTPLPPYQRKPSDALTLRLMVEALSSQNSTEARFDEIPPDGITQPQAVSNTSNTDDVNANAATAATAAAVASAAAALNIIPPSQPSDPVPLATPSTLDTAALTNLFPMPTKSEATVTSPDGTKGSTVAKRSQIQPHWTSKPRILVVEDDVVYRQLSSKFLEKFGCVTETVEDAQGAVSKMNQTKYDLVLMDIFFGPSMDG